MMKKFLSSLLFITLISCQPLDPASDVGGDSMELGSIGTGQGNGEGYTGEPVRRTYKAVEARPGGCDVLEEGEMQQMIEVVNEEEVIVRRCYGGWAEERIFQFEELEDLVYEDGILVQFRFLDYTFVIMGPEDFE